ncbi:MAG: hypothetical protein Q9191_001316 [Dirinaria sp. TL-2023a]
MNLLIIVSPLESIITNHILPLPSRETLQGGLLVTNLQKLMIDLDHVVRDRIILAIQKVGKAASVSDPHSSASTIVKVERPLNELRGGSKPIDTRRQIGQNKYDKLYELVEKERQAVRHRRHQIGSLSQEQSMASRTAPDQDMVVTRREPEEVSLQHHESVQIRAENIRLRRRIDLLKAINDRRNRWLAGSDVDITYQNQAIEKAVDMDYAETDERSKRLQRRHISHNTLLRNVKTELRSKLENLCAETTKTVIELPDAAFMKDTMGDIILNKCDSDRHMFMLLAETKETEKKQAFQQELRSF